MNPHYELAWPPQSSFFLLPPPPHRRSFFGGDPPFKRDIIIIKPDTHIFCSVQYDLYLLLNVKLLSTHSTDVASTFKDLHRDRISKGRRKEENHRKSNERKKKRFENNVQQVYSICVGNPLGNDLLKCLLYPPYLAVPEGCIGVEKVSELLFDQDAAYIAQLLQGNHFSNAAGSRIITNLKPDYG